jgi:hypothetical protein
MTGQHDAARGRPVRSACPTAEDVLVGRLRALGSELAAAPAADRRAATRARLVTMAAVRVPAAAGATPADVRYAGSPS